MKKLAAITALILALVLVLCACGSKKEDKKEGKAAAPTIEGTWQPEFDDEFSIELKNGKAILTRFSDTGNETYDGTYKIDGDKLTMYMNGGEVTGVYTVTADKLTITVEGDTSTYIRKSENKSNKTTDKSSGSLFGKSSANSIDGTWRDITFVEEYGEDYLGLYTFKNGTLTVSMNYQSYSATLEGTYKTDGNSITLTIDGERNLGTYEISGDTLSITINGGTEKFVRYDGSVPKQDTSYSQSFGIGSSKLEGQWTVKNTAEVGLPDGYSLTFQFKSGGILIMEAKGDGISSTVEGTYKTDGNNITLKFSPDAEEQKGTYKIDGKTLKITIDGDTLELTKQ